MPLEEEPRDTFEIVLLVNVSVDEEAKLRQHHTSSKFVNYNTRASIAGKNISNPGADSEVPMNCNSPESVLTWQYLGRMFRWMWRPL